MNKANSFADFLATQSTHISLGIFVVNLLIAAVLALILEVFYVRRGGALSNRKTFAGNFLLLTTTTMIIITIVKSSLALSLGLVGALSIVRFRAAIKEPEELAYLFLSIAIGLGLGADQRMVTVVGFFVVVGLVTLRSQFNKKAEDQNLYLTITSDDPKTVDLEQVVEVLKEECLSVTVQRVDRNKECLEALFVVGFESFDKFNATCKKLENLHDSLQLSFVESQVLY